MSDDTQEPIATDHEQVRRDKHEASIKRGGPLAWMTRNSVAANVFMLVLLIGGIALAPFIKQEVFPEFDLDIVTIQVPYPGASPAEVEQGVILAVEESVRGVDGVKEVTATAGESIGVVNVELIAGTDAQKALADIKNNVDRVTSFPEDAERPIVSIVSRRSQVVTLVISGDVDEQVLRELAEQMRESLLQDEDITYVELSSIRPLEISIELSQQKLREYGLTVEQVSRRVGAASVELPGGSVDTNRGQILLRTTERKDKGEEFGDIILVSQRDGTEVRLSDVAVIKDGFQESDQAAYFNGKPAVEVNVFRVAAETPISVSEAVDRVMEAEQPGLPPGITVVKWNDRSDIFKQRVDLLLRNAYLGLILVFITLGLFLQIRLAFWVALGIPVSFLGSLLVMPVADVSINMISLFAFILVLGMVVDDAIVIGEAVFRHREEGMNPMDAAIAGVREVAAPVVFSILTTCIAFMPLLFVPGVMGKFFKVIPIIVITILIISLVEGLFVLPSHLAHSKESQPGTFLGWIDKQQGRFAKGLDWVINNIYGPSLAFGLRNKWLVVAVGVATLIGCIGLVAGGRLKFTFMPKIDSDVASANIEMQFGTPVEETREVQRRVLQAAEETLEELGGADKTSRGVFSTVGRISSGSFVGGGSSSSGNLAQVAVFLVPSDERTFGSSEFAERWRSKVGDVAGLEALTFNFSTGPASGKPIDIELSHPRMDVLEAASARLAASIEDFAGVKDIDDGFRSGKEQLDFELTPDARRLGITEIDLARQLRSAFFGAEAVRQQRGRNEVRVFVRLPRGEREREWNVEKFMLRTPAGAEIPLSEAAVMTRGQSYTSINRKDGRRVIRVTADVDRGTNENDVMESLRADVLPGLAQDFKGLAYGGAGQQQQQAEAFAALKTGFLLALIGMLALMAIPFRSYVQPLVVMVAIPFGIVGAVFGHLIMGFDLSLMSMMGTVALSGVVVNDSLVMISAINEYRADGMAVTEAVHTGGVRRFRPIMLTSLTTFFGLAPMILEKSVQAQFLIPMALSLGFGIMFATFITLGIVPAIYLIVDDAERAVGRVMNFLRGLYGPRKDTASGSQSSRLEP